MLTTKFDSLFARQTLDNQRHARSNERIRMLMEENQRSSTVIDRLRQQSSYVDRSILVQLNENIARLHQQHQQLLDEQHMNNHRRKTYEHIDEQLKMRNNRIVRRIHRILRRLKINDSNYQDNTMTIRTLGRIIEFHVQ
jgi:uncharacterized protein YyaL (SSP411 family)